MPADFMSLVKEKQDAADALYGITPENRKAAAAAEGLIEKMLTGNRDGVNFGLSVREAIHTTDFPQLLMHVVNSKMLGVVEPDYIGQTLLATPVPVGRNAGSYTIPNFGEVRAQRIAEGQEFPNVTAAINRQNTTTIRIEKWGIEIGITTEALAADEMGLYARHIDAARVAMNRVKEEEIFELFNTTAQVAFDNKEYWSAIESEATLSTVVSGRETFHTRGRDADGNFNGTVHIYDFIDMIALLLQRGNTPTDVLLNPLSWTIFARNPILNGFHPFVGNDSGQTMTPMYTATNPQAAFQRARLPWALTMHITPFVRLNTAVSAGLPLLTDIYIGTRRNGVLLLQGEALSTEAYRSIERDIYRTRLKEFWGVGLADGGRCWAAMKNIRITDSYEYNVVKAIVA